MIEGVGDRVPPQPPASTLAMGIVDDHPLFRLGLRHALERQPGLRIAWDAGSAAEAHSLLGESPVDLVLMDVSLESDLDGIEATRRMTSELPQLKVVLISALTSEEVMRSAVRAGAAGYLSKQLTVTELVGTLYRIARARKLDAGFPGPSDEPAASGTERLSPREADVLAGLRDGRTNREIAERLGISHTTVNKHVHQVLRKLRVRNRAQAALLASGPRLDLGSWA